MKNRFVYSLLLVFCFTWMLFAKQDRFVKHTVTKGETINSIAQKYRVTPFDIYKLNPDSQNGIQQNSVLLIPSTLDSVTAVVPTKKEAKPQLATTHLVQPKETLFSISKKYGITVEAIKNKNDELLKNGLKTGQTIQIPSANSVLEEESQPVRIVKATNVKEEAPKQIIIETKKAHATSYHLVEPKETKYGISKKYGITVEELERLNPQIVSGLQIGTKLMITGNSNVAITNVAKEAVVEKTIPTVSTKKYLQEYVVRPKETVYSLANDFGMTEQELLILNPELKKGVKQGMIIRVPQGSKKEPIKKEESNLIKTIQTSQKKELVLLMPFNISKIESDTVNSIQSRLKKDKFLNMTLDFYSGAMMAIDSAKVLGLNVDVKVFDSQETKNSSGVSSLVQTNQLDKADAIIGPFYQTNVEKLTETVTNVPVISPLSKEMGKEYLNLYQSMPTSDALKTSIFEYMNAKQGTIVAVVDPKKGSIKEYLQQNQKNCKIVGLNARNTVVADSLKVLFQKDRMNYVVLASESTGMILATTNAMLNLQKEYQVQLVIMEQNETLDFEEISLNRLTKLKLLYPSITKPNETVEAGYFDEKYKKINKVLPNQFAVRGFDVTMDTLLRLAQEKSFEETAQSSKTEYIENQFDYDQATQGYQNKGVYILYYDTDLTIKEAI